jgi:spermidine/putrescine-binding protein
MRRRDFLKSTAAALAGPAALSLPSGRLLAAKPESIVVMTWGGLWGDSVRAGVDAAFEKATGVKVVQDRGSSPVERITKIKVSLADQKYDVVQLHDGLVPLAVKQGALEKLDRNSPRLANLKEVYPRFVQDYWVAMIYSPLGVAYNTKKVKNPPKGFADLWRPEFKNRIVLPDITHSIGPYIIPIGAIAEGKDPKDAKAGFEMLKKMAALQPIWAKDTDTIMNSLRDGEAVIGLLYKSQTYTVQGWGAPVEWVYPKEGAILYSAGTAIAKNTKNKELAESYVNLTLDPKVQTIYTEKFNYPGTNPKMVGLLPPKLQERVKMSDAEFKRLIDLDQAFMADHRAEWTDSWNRIVAG